MSDEIGNRIRERRKELGITQEELAKKLGYAHRASVNKIELGSRSLIQQRIADIAEALHTTPEYIMGWEKKPINNRAQNVKDNLSARIEKQIRQLNDTDKRAVLDIIAIIQNCNQEQCKELFRIIHGIRKMTEKQKPNNKHK